MTDKPLPEENVLKDCVVIGGDAADTMTPATGCTIIGRQWFIDHGLDPDYQLPK